MQRRRGGIRGSAAGARSIVQLYLVRVSWVRRCGRDGRWSCRSFFVLGGGHELQEARSGFSADDRRAAECGYRVLQRGIEGVVRSDVSRDRVLARTAGCEGEVSRLRGACSSARAEGRGEPRLDSNVAQATVDPLRDEGSRGVGAASHARRDRPARCYGAHGGGVPFHPPIFSGSPGVLAAAVFDAAEPQVANAFWAMACGRLDPLSLEVLESRFR